MVFSFKFHRLADYSKHPELNQVLVDFHDVYDLTTAYTTLKRMRLIGSVLKFGIAESLYHQWAASESNPFSKFWPILHSKSMKCPRCESTQVNRNGHHHGKQNYLCKQCGRQFVEFYEPRGYSDDVKKICLRMYDGGMGFREIERLTGVNHNTIIYWAKQAGSISAQGHEHKATENNAEFNEPDGE